MIALLTITDKRLGKKKLYSIIRIDFGSEALAIFGIKIMAKLEGVTYWAKPKIYLEIWEKIENIKIESIIKARPNNMVWCHTIR